jgi:MazG family protein
MADTAALFAESAAIMARLRGPGGCPWDREQTPDSIRRYTLEETYEVLDAIERRDWPNLAEELGDLLLQVLFYAQMAGEAGHFTLDDVLAGLNRKLVRRHPHVFGDAAAAAAGNQVRNLAAVEGDSQVVLRNWQAIKQMEKGAQDGERPSGYLAGVLRTQPALSEAARLGSAAARAGFDWPDARGLFDKVREEAAEIEAELALSMTLQAGPHSGQEAGRKPGLDGSGSGPRAGGIGEIGGIEKVREEVGDLLFTVANLARHLKLDAELVLRDANQKFRRRFEAMETGEQAAARMLEELTPEELELAWAKVKAEESHQP